MNPNTISEFSRLEEFLLHLQLKTLQKGDFDFEDLTGLSHLLGDSKECIDFTNQYTLLLLAKAVIGHVELMKKTMTQEQIISYIEDRIYFYMHCQSDPNIYNAHHSDRDGGHG